MVRTMCNVYRFIAVVQRRSIFGNRRTLYIWEMQDTELAIMKLVQTKYYRDEIYVLRQGESIPRSSKLRSCNIMLDHQGVLCVDGRLTRSEQLT